MLLRRLTVFCAALAKYHQQVKKTVESEEGEAQENLLHVYKYLKGRHKEEGARLFFFFLVVASARTRDNGHKVEYRRFHLNTRKHFCAMQVMEHWHSLPRYIVQSPSLDIFKSCLNVVLGNLL